MPKLKRSYGIICCRPTNNTTKEGFKILMVKKSTTYHFCEFVAGHYSKQNDMHIVKLFNNMTYHEKIDIMSLNFQNMWYRVYKENPDKVFLQGNHSMWTTSYLKKKNKFETTFIHDGGATLKKIIASSGNVDTQWEFPKGRKDSENESNIETAIREFYEETGIKDTNYKILWHLNPYVETYTDFGTTYQNIYYFAEAVGKWEPVYKFYDKMQTSEVSAVQWVTKNELSTMKLESVTYKRLLKSFDKIIKKFKNAKNSNYNADMKKSHYTDI